VFSKQYVPMLYNKDKLDKQVNWQSVGGWSQQLAAWNYTVSSCYIAMTSEWTEDLMCTVVIVI
jgi:hypothetical protein